MLPIVGGLAAGVIGWFLAKFLGDPVLAFFSLRKEAQRLFFLYGHSERGPGFGEAKIQLGDLAGRFDSLPAGSPLPLHPILRLLGYDLRAASRSISELSRLLGARRSTWFLVMAQEALRLPIDRADREAVDVEKRLLGVQIPP
jgi:hypothetical protein